MSWMIDNWYIVIGLITFVSFCIWLVLGFLKLPTDKQKEKVKEWLIWACIEAEKALQSGTGQLKLRQVYNLFCAVPAFTWVAKLISFETFSDLVSDALVEVKEMLVNNKVLAEYVYGANAETEIEKIKNQLTRMENEIY